MDYKKGERNLAKVSRIGSPTCESQYMGHALYLHTICSIITPCLTQVELKVGTVFLFFIFKTITIIITVITCVKTHQQLFFQSNQKSESYSTNCMMKLNSECYHTIIPFFMSIRFTLYLDFPTCWDLWALNLPNLKFPLTYFLSLHMRDKWGFD